MTVIDEKYLSKINEFPSGSAFRGQAKSRWLLHSGATRRLIKYYPENVTQNSSFSQIYVNYHRAVLINPACTNGFDIDDGHQISDLQLLAKLQHFEAATGLLDFTWNPLVALWFACKDNDNCDGKVFVADLRNPVTFKQIPNETEKQSVEAIFSPNSDAGKLLYWEAKIHGAAAARILRQRSVFVIGRPLIPEDVVDYIEIKASDKSAIRKELEDIFDVSDRTLFMDIHGFSVANKAGSPLYKIEDPNYYYSLGNQSYQQGDYSQAITNYDKCISLAQDVSQTYFLRGNAKAEVRNYPDAKQDYDLAIHHKDRPFHNLDPNTRILFNPILWMVYCNRGNIRAELKDYEGALKDYDEALRLSPQCQDPIAFFNRANVSVILRRFENAIEDYNKAIALGYSNAYFNKGNALVFLGRFNEAFQCYQEAATEETDDPVAIANNYNGMARILSMIDGAEYESHFAQDEYHIVVHVQVDSDSLSEVTFLFTGNKGNTGNFGYISSGGQEFDGENPFLIKVSSQQG